jgi:hypothetical protein
MRAFERGVERQNQAKNENAVKANMFQVGVGKSNI